MIPKPDIKEGNQYRWSSYEKALEAYTALGWSDDSAGFEYEVLSYHPIRGCLISTYIISITTCACGATKGHFIKLEENTPVWHCAETRRTTSCGLDQMKLINTRRVTVKQAREFINSKGIKNLPFGLPLSDEQSKTSVFK